MRIMISAQHDTGDAKIKARLIPPDGSNTTEEDFVFAAVKRFTVEIKIDDKDFIPPGGSQIN